MATLEPWATVEYQAPNAAWASAVLELRARVAALEAAANDRQPAAKAPPADGLVERVAAVVGKDRSYARAAIREVARWMRAELVSRNMAERLEQEADRG